MAEQKILISIKINDREAANTQKQLKVTKDNFNSLTDAEKKKIIADKQLALSAKEVDKSLTQQAAAANAAAAATDKMRATSGLNNAIIMESSRLASDASFGFTAIANNLSQLVNLFQMNVKATGSFTSAISGLFTAQAAVLIGIQLLITYGDRLAKAIMDAANSGSILNDTFKDLGGEVSSSAGNFETYIKILQDSNRSQEQQNIAVEKLKEEFPEYITQLDEAGVSLQDVAKNTKEAKKQNDDYRDSLIQLGMSRAAQTKIEELSAERLNLVEERRKHLRAQGIVDEEDAKKEINRINEQYGDEFIKYDEEYNEIVRTTDKVTQQALLRRLEQSNIGKLKSRRDFLAAQKGFNEEEIKELDEQIKQFSEYRILSNKNEEKESKKRNRIFKASKDFTIKELDFNKQIQKSQQNLRQSFIKDESFKINETARAQKEVQALRRDDYIKQQEEKKNNFIAAQKTRLDNFLAEEKDEKKRAAATKIYNDAAKQAEDEFLAAKSTAYDKYNVYVVEKDKETKKLLTDQSIKDAQELQEVNRQKLDAEAAYFDELDGISGDYSFFQSERNISNLQSDIAAQQAVVDSHAVGTIEREQAEMRLYQLKSDLNVAEQSDAEQKFAFFKEQYQAITGALSQTFEVSAENETIALEKSYSKRIAAAEGDAKTQERLQRQLEVKKDKIAKKAFERNKAVRIGEALMTVFQNGFLAYGSQLFPGDVTSPVRASIQQAITIAAGLANVANIARQKYKSSVSSSGGGSSGSSAGARTIQAPDFNVVGASQTSQLAQTVAGAQSTPVKAFVVGKDVSTQQELDRNITNTASFG